MDGDDFSLEAVPSNKTPGKGNMTKHRGVVNRPIASSIVKAQEEFKLFTANPDDIDHNLYGRFLGILKDAGVPWKVKRLPESREDAMHMMNAVVLAINAYQHYQRDVEESFAELESTMSMTRTHSHAQATEVSKLNNELTKMKKEFTTQTRTLAKESTTSREMVATLKSRLAQAERDINDANTQIRKQKKELNEEQRRCKALTSQLAAESKPRYSRKSLPGPGPGVPRHRAGSMNGSGLDGGAGVLREGDSARASASPGVTRSNSSIGHRASMQSPAQAVTEGFVPQQPWPDYASPSPQARDSPGYCPSPYEASHTDDVLLHQRSNANRSVTMSPRPPHAVAPTAVRPSPPLPVYSSDPQVPPRAPSGIQQGGAPQVPALQMDDLRHSVDNIVDQDSGDELDGEITGSGKKKKNSLKKFMNKLKFSTKEKSGIIPQPSM
jgi:hypothetical protein